MAVQLDAEVSTVEPQDSSARPVWEAFVRDGQVEVAYRFELVPFGRLVVDYHEDVFNGLDDTATLAVRAVPSKALAYQRKQDKIAKRMVREGVKADLFGVLIVNRREDGTYAVVDGGSRLRALDQLGVPDAVKVPCLVFHWDDNREIRNYVDLNSERSGLTQVDKFVAKVKYGDEDAVAINRVLIEETGKGVGYKGWQCVYALETAYSSGNLYRLLVLMRELGWLERGRNQTMVGALHRLMGMPNFDPDHALERWRGWTVGDVINGAKEQKEIAGQSRSIARLAALVLAQPYNKHLKHPRRLDTTRLTPKADVDDDE